MNFETEGHQKTPVQVLDIRGLDTQEKKNFSSDLILLSKWLMKSITVTLIKKGMNCHLFSCFCRFFCSQVETEEIHSGPIRALFPPQSKSFYPLA